ALGSGLGGWNQGHGDGYRQRRFGRIGDGGVRTEPSAERKRVCSCPSRLRLIAWPQKPGTMPPYHPIVRGLFAMILHQFYYQLVVLGLLWLFVMLYLAWPGPDVTLQPKPAKPITPPRHLSPDLTPFALLPHKLPSPVR